MQMAVSCKIQQLDDGYWSSVIIGLGGEHCEHSAPRIIVACCVCVCVSCAWRTAAQVLRMPHTEHTKTISDKTELNVDSGKNRGYRSFLATGQIVIYRCHYSYSKEGIKDNRNVGKTSYKRISG